MIEAEKRKAIFLLHQEGLSFGEIARLMSVSRSAVQAIIKQHGEMPSTVRSDKILIDADLLRRLYTDCQGYAQRVYEKLGVVQNGVTDRIWEKLRHLRSTKRDR